MRITKIQIDRLAVDLRHPYHLSKEYGIFSTATPVVVTLYTDEGFVGYGECDPWPLFTGDSDWLASLILEKHLGPMLLGADPTNIHAIHERMDRIIRGQHLTKSAIDMAAYDIWGKSVGKPVHQLLGGQRRGSMKCMWSIGGSTPEESAADVLAAKAAGYHGCMIKIGGPDYQLDASRTIAVREAVGKDFPLIVDANQGWDVDTAIRYAKLVKNCDILFFEQPVQSWDVQGMARVRRAIDIPVSADEGVMTLADARNLIAADAVDVFSIKVAKNGGIQPAKEICDYAAACGIPVFFNSMIEEGITQAASLQLGVTCSNIVHTIGHAYFSPLRLTRDLTNFSACIHPEQGLVEVPRAPGLGVELNPDAMQACLTGSVIIE